MPWSPRPDQSAETPRNRRQEETFRKVLTAGVEMLRESSYADLTVRAVAARAKVAPATAYTYFSSKNHLIAEAYLDLMRQVPYFTDVNDSTPTRVEKALRAMTLVIADEPEVAAACTTALLSGNDQAVTAVRDRIGAEIHRRIRSAMGPDADPRTVSALEMTYFGALVHAGSGYVSYREIADRLTYVVGLILGEDRWRPPVTVPTSDVILDPYDYDFHEDPYPYYKRLRDDAPLYYNSELGFWALSRHADVREGFRNSTTLSNKFGVSLDPVSRGPHASKTMSFLAMDDPDHLRLRTLVSKGFTPRRIRELESSVVALAVAHLDTMLDKSASGETVDYVAEFAGKLPMDVISELMGVPVEDRDRIRALADGVMHRDDGVKDVPAAAIEASINLFVYYQQMIADRRKKPADDLTSALLEAEIDGDRLTDEEVLGFLFLMVIAGNETTTKLLANAAFWGHKNPDQLTPVYDDLDRIPLWVEETLRYDTSSQLLARTVEGELKLYDTTIPDGDILLLLPGSGHRDERVFSNPDDFVIGREIGSNLLSFGSGAHFCLGAHLARMEARVALAELFKRIRGFEVDEANSVRVHSSSVRGFAHLPMTVQTR